MRGQTGEGVSHYVPVSETSKWSPPLSARCRSHSRRAGCRGCGAGVTTANRTRIWCAVAPARAINENAFASACVRCGQCVQACPYDTLKLATLASGLSAGTPYFVARDIPCEMCEDIPCAKVCPSGALDREIESIDDARMGLAVLVDQENCLNFQGLRCDVCYRECPKIDEAITPSWSATREPVSTPAFCRRFTATPVPAAVSAKKCACWNNRQSRCYRCHWRKGS